MAAYKEDAIAQAGTPQKQVTISPASSFAPLASGSAYATFRCDWNPSAPFLESVDGQSWSYAELDRITADCSRRLQGAGIVKGDRLVSQLDRSPWNIFLYLACMRAGIIYVPLSPQLTPAETAPILADAEPALFVCAPRLLEITRSLLDGSGTRILTLDQDGSGSLVILTAADIEPDAEVDPDDAAAIIFTSGTTGRPKGAVLSHRLFSTKAKSLAQGLGYRRDDKLLHVMPLYHAHGLFMTTHCVLCAGASMLLLPRFDVAEVVAHLPQVSLFSGVPTMYKRLLGTPSLQESSRGMRIFIAGSAPLPPDVFLQFEEQSGHRIVECWGMSETMTNTANPLSGERKPGSAGKPLPGVEVRTLDAQGRPTAPGEPGVLAVRASTRLKGYWRRQEGEQPRYHDGFFVTGDIGYFDPEGYLVIIGRNSDVIISGGYNVYPKEVELSLEQMEGVAKAAVFGLPHPDYGEAVAAAIECQAGARIDAGELLACLKSRLTSYKVPKALFVIDRLPLTELGKIQRRPLVEQFRQHFIGAPDQAPAPR
jgi:malonyl-CoA/methylmalonyl-CoA synthetase